MVFLNGSLCPLLKVETKHLVSLSMTTLLQNLLIFNQNPFASKTLEEFTNSLQITFFFKLKVKFQDFLHQFFLKVLEQRESLSACPLEFLVSFILQFYFLRF